MALRTPVALFVFNRPVPTQRVFNRIARAQPSSLFLIADGPRAGHPSDEANCQAVRRIVDHVTWPCRVLKQYSATNLGLPERVTSGISWIFDHVEECIFLEDDCLPSASFFPFCTAMLERYRHEAQIMQINGYSYQFGRVTTADSYYFSRITCPWGWATWRRAWQHYDVRVRRWAELRDTDWLQEIMQHPHTVCFFQTQFDKAYRGELKAWAVQWTFACWQQAALAISPRDDLIMNIGFDVDAPHTKGGGEEYNRPPAEMTFPLRHPASMVRNLVAEAFYIHYIADLCACTDSRSDAPHLYPWLPAPIRYGVQALLPQRLRRALVHRLTTQYSPGVGKVKILPKDQQ